MLELIKKVYLEYSRESDGNAALYTEGRQKPRNYKKFKGNCSYCGIQGHKQADCHKKKAVEKSGEEALKMEKSGEETLKLRGENKKCWWCKEKGHIVKECPTKKKNLQDDAFFVGMALFLDDDIEPQTLRAQYELECKVEVNHLDAAAQLERLQDQTCLLHPGASFLPNVHVAEDSIFNWIVQRNRGDMANVELDIEDTRLSVEQAKTNSDDGSREYEEAFEDIRMCPGCQHKGPLYMHCTYCKDPELQYSMPIGMDDYRMNEMDKEHEAAIACAKAFLWNIAEGAMGAILANVEVEGSTESKEADSKESKQSSQNDWVQVNQVGNKEQKIDKWLIDSGASMHVMNQKEDLQEPKKTLHAVTIRSGKAVAAHAIGIKPTILCDAYRNTIELADTLYILEFKKKIISLSKLLDQGYKVKEWTKEYFWLSKND